MSNKIKVNTLRTFVDERGDYGNPTGIVLDIAQQIKPDARQKIATTLHFTDTVFINSFDPVNVSFFNSEQETKFAGDSLISTTYFISHVLGKNADPIICKGGGIKTWREGELTWIEASLDGTPGWQHQQISSAADVDNITPEQASSYEHTMVWAWANETKGLIRSRTFLPDWGTLEDQGNGSGSMQLAKALNRQIEIHQGRGSIIYAAPSSGNLAKVGGRVRIDTAVLI